MIKDTPQTESNNPNSNPTPSQGSVIQIDVASLNSKLIFKGKKSLLSYARWVLDTKANREVLKEYLLHTILFRKGYKRQLKYLKCCNVFYYLDRTKTYDHDPHQKSFSLLLTEEERELISDFIEQKRHQRVHMKNKTFRQNLVPELISFARGLKLPKIDSFIDSLPRNEGCFEFPISKQRLTFNCMAKSLNKKNRVSKVDQKHNLVFNPQKINTKSEVASPSHSKEGELSPTAKKIIELNGSSNKKLKVDQTTTDCVAQHLFFTKSGRKVKREPAISDPFFGMEDTAHGKIFKSWSKEVTSTSGVGFPEAEKTSKKQEAQQSNEVEVQEEKEDLAFLMSKMSFFSGAPGLIKSAKPQKTELPKSCTPSMSPAKSPSFAGNLMGDSSEASNQPNDEDGNEYPLKLARELLVKIKEVQKIARELKKGLRKKGKEKPNGQ